MRDRIGLNDLTLELREMIQNNSGYTKDEIDSMIKDIISTTKAEMNTTDFNNYYNKTETDVKINKTIATYLVDHNTDQESHNPLKTRIHDITDIISHLSIGAEVYPLPVLIEGQVEFTISDPKFEPREKNPTSIVIWNSVLLTEYSIEGRTLKLNSGVPKDSNLTLIIFSIKGAV